MAKSNPVQIKFIFYDLQLQLQLPPGDSPKFDPPSMHLCTAMQIICVHILEPKKCPLSLKRSSFSTKDKIGHSCWKQWSRISREGVSLQWKDLNLPVLLHWGAAASLEAVLPWWFQWSNGASWSFGSPRCQIDCWEKNWSIANLAMWKWRQGGRSWLAFGKRKIIPQSFRRARICKFSRQKRRFYNCVNIGIFCCNSVCDVVRTSNSPYQ